MILIDRSKNVQSIILTLDGVEAHSKLLLRHDETQTRYEVDLGVSVSPAPDRYDKFNVSTSAFDLLPEGFYSYSIYDLFGEVATLYGVEFGSVFTAPFGSPLFVVYEKFVSLAIEQGKLLIKPAPAKEIPSAPDLSVKYKVFTK